MESIFKNSKENVMRASEDILNDSSIAMLNNLKAQVYECGKARIILNVKSGDIEYSMEFNEAQQATIDWCDKEIDKVRKVIAGRYRVELTTLIN